MGSVGMEKVLVVLFYSLMVITWCLSQRAAYVTITPATLTLSHAMTSSGGEVTIRCTGTTGDTTLYSLKISRVLAFNSNSTSTTLLHILHHNLEPQVIYPIEGSTASGRVTENFLTLRMARAKCEDAGVYTCEAAYLKNSLSAVSANQSLHVEVDPGYLTVSSEPAYKNWVVNQTVTLTCAGPLGTINPDTQVVWHWEFWETSEGKWRPDGSASDITIQRTNQQPCYQNGSSQLIRSLRLVDSKRVYRCYVEKDGVSFPQFAGRYEFGYVVPVPDSTVVETYTDGVVFGASVGVGITLVVVIVIVVIVLMCLWSKGLICSDGEAQDSISIEAEDDSFTATTTERKTTQKPPKRNRNVALQTTLNNNDEDDEHNNINGYDVIDNSAVTSTATTSNPAYFASSTKRGVAVSSRSAHSSAASVRGSRVVSHTLTSKGHTGQSGKLFYARGEEMREERREDKVEREEEEEEEEERNVSGSVLDLASAQQQQAAAEEVLRTLLSTRHVLSWKVSGDGGFTTFLLRLSPSTYDDVDPPTFPGGVQRGRWRKKNPAVAAAGLQHPGGMLVALPEARAQGSEGYHYYESPRR